MASELLGRRDAVTWMKMAMSIKLYLPKLVSAGVVVIGHVPLYLCTSVLDGFSALCPSVIRLLTKSSRVQRSKYRSSEKWPDDARACTKGEVARRLGAVVAAVPCTIERWEGGEIRDRGRDRLKLLAGRCDWPSTARAAWMYWSTACIDGCRFHQVLTHWFTQLETHDHVTHIPRTGPLF